MTELLNSLGTAQDQLPRVQHILLQMWNRVRETRKDQPVCLTPDDYREAGGFESALNQHADYLYGELGLAPGWASRRKSSVSPSSYSALWLSALPRARSSAV